MLRLICLLGLAVVACEAAAALEPVRVDREAFISKAILADQRLWLLADSGTLAAALDQRECADSGAEIDGRSRWSVLRVERYSSLGR